MQQKSFQNRKRKFVRVCSVQAGDDVLLSRDPRDRRHIYKSAPRTIYCVQHLFQRGGHYRQRVSLSEGQCVKTEDILQIEK